MKRSVAALLVFASGLCVVGDFLGVVEEVDRYVYVVYYGGADCDKNAVSIHGKVSNEEFLTQGGSPWSNTSANKPHYYECGFQNSCMINPTSPQCLQLNRSISGVVELATNKYGRVVECDETNESSGLNECFVLEGCTISTVFPSCHAYVYIPRTFSPNFLLNSEGVGLGDWTSYMVFYSDNQCQKFEGVQGILAGKQDIVVANTTCEDAMACLYAKDGENCGLIDPYLKTTQTFFTKNEGHTTYNCTSEEGDVCVEHEDVCAPSPIPQCHFRWVSAQKLFANPASYLTLAPTRTETKSSATKCESGGHARYTSYRAHTLATAIFSYAVVLLFW